MCERCKELEEALRGVVYCVTCWDNPGKSLCEEHLKVCRKVLKEPGTPPAASVWKTLLWPSERGRDD
jgi:hypothetical protein